MTDERRCSKCDTPLGPDVGPEGCPACLLEAGMRTVAAEPDDAEIPERIDDYRPLRLLGEGGMGRVYLARQEHPIRREVALKVIKLGMDSRAVISRFEAERQALALMDHAHIAKVFDAGITERGRPYFVMEYVKGVPINEFCDRHKLTNRERLALFAQVCEGVQHAHQKAVVHRDLKPSNVLVTVQDDKRIPKIIDFGVAKATAQKLTEKTLFTEEGVLIGTPEYMSPEQAEMTGENVDTRTDVYSLGVMLYELLAGALPFDPTELRRAGLEEIRRRIREEDPAPPSKRVSTLGEQSTQSARRRKVDRPTLVRQLSGDLDWITMKALEKDRVRRYGSPQELAADIGRYLSDEPVLASPPSTAYRAKKFVRRHRFGVSAAAALVVGLVILATTMTVQARRIARARGELSQVVEFQSGMLRAVDPEQMGRRLMDDLAERVEAAHRAGGASDDEVATAKESLKELTSGVNATSLALEALDQNILAGAVTSIGESFGDQPVIDARLRTTLGETYLDLGLYKQAHTQFEQALALRDQHLGRRDLSTLNSINSNGVVLERQGRFDEAEPFMREALDGFRQLLGEDHPYTLASINNLGMMLKAQGKLDEAEPLIREALEGRRRALGADHPDTLSSMNNLGFVLRTMDRLEEAEPYTRDALDGLRRVLGDDHIDTLGSISNMGSLLESQGKLDEAEPFYREAVERKRRVLGDDHPETLIAIGHVGNLLQAMGRLDEAAQQYRESLSGYRRVLGNDHPHTLTSLNNLGLLLARQRRFDEAEPLLLEALDGKRRVLGEDHLSTLASLNSVGFLFNAQEKYDEAEPYFRETVERTNKVLGPDHSYTLTSTGNLANLYQSLGRLEDAEPLMRKALEGMRRVLGDDHPTTLGTVGNLGMLLVRRGKLEDAEPLLRESLDGSRRVLGNDHPATFTAANSLGFLLGELERFEEAEPFYLEAAEGCIRVLGEDHPSTVQTMGNLVVLYRQWGKPEAEAEWSERLPAEWLARLPEK